MKKDLRDFGILFLSSSLFALAIAIAYFGYQISLVTSKLPDILDSVNNTANQIEPVLNEINEIKEFIPPILDETGRIRELVPDILEEVAATRESIPPVLKEVAATRETIPLILDEVSATRKAVPPILDEVEKTRKELPAILKTVDNATTTLNNTNKEIEATRNAINPALDRAEAMIADAKTIGKKTTEGAITGVVTGVVKTPFSLLGFGPSSPEDDVTGLSAFSDKDKKIAENALAKLTLKPVGSTQEWNNPETGLSGKITYVSDYESKGKDCVVLRNQAMKGGKQIVNKQFGMCRDENDAWKLDK